MKIKNFIITVCETEKTTLAALASEDEKTPEKEKTPLVVAFSEYDNTCNPFYQNGEFDSFINEITGEKLLTRDRNGRIVYNGIDGERIMYNGTYYEYSGIADVAESYDEELDETSYVINLRRDVKFSDGETMDADDLIFTLYMLLDPSMSAVSDIQGMGIKGEVNYRLNSSIADTFTEEDISEALASDEVKEKIRNTIVVPVLKSEYEWVKSLYEDNSYAVYTESYPDPKDLMAFFYSVNSEYDSTAVPGEQKVLSDLAGEQLTVTFVPHLLPVNRGIVSTMYLKLKYGVTKEQIRKAYEEKYANEQFVRVLSDGATANLRNVKFTNMCDISLHIDSRTGTLIVVSTIDNMVKGAAGQAIQNMNIILGIDETLGLRHYGLHP